MPRNDNIGVLEYYEFKTQRFYPDGNDDFHGSNKYTRGGFCSSCNSIFNAKNWHE